LVRRRLTLKRIDPWSVLKFGFIANLSLLAIGLLGAAVMWFFVERLGLVTSVCEIAIEMGVERCGVNGGNLFRALFLLGLLGVIVQTGVFVFLAFLYNLIADLVGGLAFTFTDDTPGAAARGDVPATGGRAVGTVTETPQRPAPLGSTGNTTGTTPAAGGPAGGEPSGERMWGDTTRTGGGGERSGGG
jgi:hypothetical protein